QVLASLADSIMQKHTRFLDALMIKNLAAKPMLFCHFSRTFRELDGGKHIGRLVDQVASQTHAFSDLEACRKLLLLSSARRSSNKHIHLLELRSRLAHVLVEFVRAKRRAKSETPG